MPMSLQGSSGPGSAQARVPVQSASRKVGKQLYAVLVLERIYADWNAMNVGLPGTELIQDFAMWCEDESYCSASTSSAGESSMRVPLSFPTGCTTPPTPTISSYRFTTVSSSNTAKWRAFISCGSVRQPQCPAADDRAVTGTLNLIADTRHLIHRPGVPRT